jgi:hypothetical protein
MRHRNEDHNAKEMLQPLFKDGTVMKTTSQKKRRESERSYIGC